MKAAQLSGISTAELVVQFAQIAIRQGDDLLGEDTRSYNRLFDKMRAIELELKARPGDQRSELLTLLDHPNIAVRWKAAVATLAVAPIPAREALHDVAASAYVPIAGHAASTLRHYDSGFFKPT